jgi:hypothetical protein
MLARFLAISSYDVKCRNVQSKYAKVFADTAQNWREQEPYFIEREDGSLVLQVNLERLKRA